MNQFTESERHRRSYAPKGLSVLRGPGEDYSHGAIWVVADQHGYAEVRFMHDSKAYYENTLYIEDIRIKENERRKGFGRLLYEKIEAMARNMGVDYIQLDSEMDAVGFWRRMGFRDLDAVYYQNKTAMIKEI